jgi:hypothetical protein
MLVHIYNTIYTYIKYYLYTYRQTYISWSGIEGSYDTDLYFHEHYTRVHDVKNQF